ncbi:MAG TPA: hypothetical protein PKK06_03605 [Phycisphaerae bacterium]|nr:hypothetical protein [Phycisphaerae bacterium]HNU45364.1 hypothetical protein [Phycisphaerae bacterium]
MLKKVSAFLVPALLALAALMMPLSSGCARSEGRYFENSRQGQPHHFRNRIYNPADERYVHAE